MPLFSMLHALVAYSSWLARRPLRTRLARSAVLALSVAAGGASLAAQAQVAPRATVKAPAPAAVHASDPVQRHIQDMRACGCALGRLVRPRRGGAALAGAGVGLAAVVNPRASESVQADVPLEKRVFTLPAWAGTWAPDQVQLVSLHTAAAPVGTEVRLMRHKNTRAADATKTSAEGPRNPGDVPPRLGLGPLRDKNGPACGGHLTHTISIGRRDGAKREELVLAAVTTAGTTRAYLIDARQAIGMGLGRAGPCDQGVPLKTGAPLEVALAPIYADLTVGAPWRFRTTGQLDDVPELVAPAADAADADRGENPFLRDVPGARGEVLDKTKDKVALGAAVGVVALAVLAAALMYAVRRKRGHIARATCPVCTAEVQWPVAHAGTRMPCTTCGQAEAMATKTAAGWTIAWDTQAGDTPRTEE